MGLLSSSSRTALRRTTRDARYGTARSAFRRTARDALRRTTRDARYGTARSAFRRTARGGCRCGATGGGGRVGRGGAEAEQEKRGQHPGSNVAMASAHARVPSPNSDSGCRRRRTDPISSRPPGRFPNPLPRAARHPIRIGMPQVAAATIGLSRSEMDYRTITYGRPRLLSPVRQP
ncbi:hypothetical protein GCM10023107_24800 [Actinoplanes octamycinicus]|nr:hypothetical protein Aoc01nite_58100 [Actinoplanes octamycinicus]